MESTLIPPKTAVTLLAVLLVVCVACGSQTEEAQPRPNILVFLADDHGQWASGPYGSRDIETPNLDRLADNGILMANATSSSPVCSPARTSLLTGRLPSQHGVHDFLSERPEFDRGWLDDEILLPELLQDAGYRTALIGKWHSTATSHVPFRGFDRWLSYDVRPEGWRNQYLKEGPIHFSDEGNPITVEGYQLEYLGEAARQFIRTGDAPFFLLFAPTDTHGPFAGNPEEVVAGYREATFSDVPRNELSHLPPANAESVPPEDLGEILAQYGAAVTRQDTELGRLIELLEERGVLENTLVVYTSDHGLMVGHHGLLGKSNATLPQNLYEDSIRVPMILSWPQALAETGTTLDIPFDHLDLFRTILHAAGIRLSDDLEQRIDSPGRSLMPRLNSPDAGWRRHRFSEHGNARSVSDGRFKLVERYPPIDPRFGDELYDLEADPRETTNLIDEAGHRGVVTDLGRALDEHFSRYEVAGKSGVEALSQPPSNGAEPWRRLAGQMAIRQE